MIRAPQPHDRVAECTIPAANAPFRRFATGIRIAAARAGRLFPALTRSAWWRPRLVVPHELEECGFGVIDWRAVPSPVTVELLRAADRIARDGHAVAFTGRPYRTGPELTVDRRPTTVRYLSGQPGPATTPETASQVLITTLDGLVSSGRRIAVVSGQPELSQQDADQAVSRWQATLLPGGEPSSVDIYGRDWTLHSWRP
jgi:hypothetical protein